MNLQNVRTDEINVDPSRVARVVPRPDPYCPDIPIPLSRKSRIVRLESEHLVDDDGRDESFLSSLPKDMPLCDLDYTVGASAIAANCKAAVQGDALMLLTKHQEDRRGQDWFAYGLRPMGKDFTTAQAHAALKFNQSGQLVLGNGLELIRVLHDPHALGNRAVLALGTLVRRARQGQTRNVTVFSVCSFIDQSGQRVVRLMETRVDPDARPEDLMKDLDAHCLWPKNLELFVTHRSR